MEKTIRRHDNTGVLEVSVKKTSTVVPPEVVTFMRVAWRACKEKGEYMITKMNGEGGGMARRVNSEMRNGQGGINQANEDTRLGGDCLAT